MLDVQPSPQAPDLLKDVPCRAEPMPSKQVVCKARQELRNGFYMIYVNSTTEKKKRLSQCQIEERQAKIARYESYMQSKHGVANANRWQRRVTELTECSLHLDAEDSALKGSLAEASKAAKTAVKNLQKVLSSIDLAGYQADGLATQAYTARDIAGEALEALAVDEDYVELEVRHGEPRESMDKLVESAEPSQVHVEEVGTANPSCPFLLKSGQRVGQVCARRLPCRFHTR